MTSSDDVISDVIGSVRALCAGVQVLRLFHFLVKFGYYGSEDIKALLRPLIAVLDCKHDKPFPQDSDKGRQLPPLVHFHRLKHVLPKVTWEERVALAQLRNTVPVGYNGTPQINPRTALSPSTTTTPI